MPAATIPSAPDARYYGYSTGHWDGDYTFVVDTVGTDDSTWLDSGGHPHSSDLHVIERYERVDHDTLKVSVTADDPKVYAKPFLLGTTIYKWIPDQEFEEQLCIPSEAQAYADNIAGARRSQEVTLLPVRQWHEAIRRD